MERNIRPCKSKSGKWKRNARLKNLIAPYSHTTRRSVQRFRNRPTEPFGKCRSNHNLFEPSQLQTSDNLDISVIGPDETRRVGDETGFTDITNFADHPGKSIPQNLSPQEIADGFESYDMVNNAEASSLEYGNENLVIPKPVSLGVNGLPAKLLSFISRFKLSNVASNALLKMLRSSDAEEIRKLPTSLAKLDTNVFSECPEFVLRWICSNCSQNLSIKTVPNVTTNQRVSCCGIEYTTNDSHGLYISIRLILRTVLPRIWKFRDMTHMNQKIMDRFVALELNPTCDLSLTLNTDGVPTSKSSNGSIWPILAYIDNLPPKVLQQNILLLGVWIGHESIRNKPDMNIFLEPVVNEINSLTSEGILWNLDTRTEIRTRICVSKVLCDSMARPAVQNMQQLNGEYGCGYCFHREKMHYFKHVPLAPLRTDADHRQLCQSHTFNRGDINVTRGVTGKSVLLNLPYLDIIYDIPPCFLHTIYLGVARTFTQFLLTNSGCPGRITKQALQVMNDNLLLIKPPHRVSRTPRPLSEIAHWKGHEWGMWLIYYSPILLQQALPIEYWHHWIQLVYGCSMLLKSARGIESEVVKIRLESSSKSLELFSRDVAHLYGSQACRFNVHLLRHLPEIALKWGGDILNTTMGPFESYNAVLQGFLNNSQFMGNQIGRRYWRYLQSKNEILDLRGNVFQGMLSNYEPPAGVNLPTDNGPPSFYSHIRVGPNKIYSQEYKKSILRYSACVRLSNGTFAEVLAFAKSGDQGFAILRVLTVVQFATLTHIYRVTGISKLETIQIADIAEIVLRVDCGVHKFVCVFLNNVEHVRE